MKLLDWILRPSPAQQFINSHAAALRKMNNTGADKLADLLVSCEFDTAASFIWDLDDPTRRDIPPKTWSLLLSLGSDENF